MEHFSGSFGWMLFPKASAVAVAEGVLLPQCGEALEQLTVAFTVSGCGMMYAASVDL